jgi:hypothetical protein
MFIATNTKDLQLSSFGEFAAQLGCYYDHRKYTAIGAYSLKIKFADMIRLHNATTWKTNGFRVSCCGHSFPHHMWVNAQNKKRVLKIKLQRLRGGEIKVQNHLVRLLGTNKTTVEL